MAINFELLIAAPMLQDLLVDKSTGEPMSAGIINLYQDNNRIVRKNWYYQTNISGIQGQYTYLPLDNPLTLSLAGTIQDLNGNDVIPFYYPYDENDQTVDQAYYITVFNAANVPQFTRENFPFNPNQSNETNDQSLINLIPNGQFLSHNNLPALPPSVEVNQVQNGAQQVAVATEGSTVLIENTSVIVAQGASVGWYFIKPQGSTDTDFIEFTQILQEPANLTGNPRYAINLSCTDASGNDTFKELRIRFNNVNHFASTIQPYTFSLTGMNNNPGVLNLAVNYIKYFGVGGSSPVQVEFDTYSLLEGEFNLFSTTPVIFGNNDLYTIGTGNDDYIEISISLPSTTTFNIEITDVLLTPGQIAISSYPDRPNNIVFSTAIAGSIPTPDPDGMDLYLSPVLTRGGMAFDRSVLAKPYASLTSPVSPLNTAATTNEMLLDGSEYLTAGYSTIGVPFRRLQQILFNTTYQIPKFGTGATFVNAYIVDLGGTNNQIQLSTNQGGVQTATADGVSVPTGFGFATAVTPTALSYDVFGQIVKQANTMIVRGTVPNTGSIGQPEAGTSGFTVTELRNLSVNYCIFTVVAIPASTLAGKYWAFSTEDAGNFYVWYKVDGIGVDPAPGGTGILVNLLTDYTAQDVIYFTCDAINAYQVSTINCEAGSSVPNGSYWTFFSNAQQYYVWYNVGGFGVDPHPLGGIGIEVPLAGTETSTQVASATQLAINSYSFAIPDAQGLFLRGVDPDNVWDFDNALRAAWVDNLNLAGAVSGTFEYDQFLSHNHTVGSFQNYGNLAQSVETMNNLGNDSPTGFTGGTETRPVNMDVYWVIKY